VKRESRERQNKTQREPTEREIEPKTSENVTVCQQGCYILDEDLQGVQNSTRSSKRVCKKMNNWENYIVSLF